MPDEVDFICKFTGCTTEITVPVSCKLQLVAPDGTVMFTIKSLRDLLRAELRPIT